MTMKCELVRETKFSSEDIANFVLDCPSSVFDTARQWHVNFRFLIDRLFDKNLILVFSRGAEITGVCGYCFVNEKDKSGINKIRWTLPENITNQDMLYVVVCVLKNDCNIWEIRKELKRVCVNRNTKEALWFADSKWYRRSIINEN